MHYTKDKLNSQYIINIFNTGSFYCIILVYESCKAEKHCCAFGVIPWLDHGIQSFFKFFLDTVVKPRYDTILVITRAC